jgi:hypothetical protein
MHAELAGLVGGGAHHAPFGRVPVAAHDDRFAPQFGPAQHLNSREELVEVDVEHPAGHKSKFRP